MEADLPQKVLLFINLIPPSPGILISIPVAMILLFISATISAAEVALSSLKPADRNSLEQLNTNSSRKVLQILKNPDSLLTSTMFSNITVNFTLVIVSLYLFSGLLTFTIAPLLGIIIEILIISLLIILLGEILPRIYASHNSFRIALKTSGIAMAIIRIVSPISNAINNSGTSIIKKLSPAKGNISLEQLSDALDTSGVNNEDRKILRSIVNFSSMEVSNIMNPRSAIVAVEINTGFSTLVDVITESGYSRLPVFTETFDNINGILYVKDMIPYLGNPKEFSLQKLIRPCYYVPHTKKIKTLLQEFLEKKIHMAVVVDEYGGTEGIVTLEDVLEQIVGDITDEFDEVESRYTRIDDRTYIFDGKTLIDDFLGILQLPEESFEDITGEADTIAGLILEHKGEIPRVNEVLNIKNLSFTIISADSRRIKKVRVVIDKPSKKQS